MKGGRYYVREDLSDGEHCYLRSLDDETLNLDLCAYGCEHTTWNKDLTKVCLYLRDKCCLADVNLKERRLENRKFINTSELAESHFYYKFGFFLNDDYVAFKAKGEHRIILFRTSDATR